MKYRPYVGFRADSEMFDLLSSLNPRQPGKAAKEILRLYMALVAAGKADLERMGEEERTELMEIIEKIVRKLDAEGGKQRLCDLLIALQQHPKARFAPLHVQLAMIHTAQEKRARVKRVKKKK